MFMRYTALELMCSVALGKGFVMARTTSRSIQRPHWILPVLIGALVILALGSWFIISRARGTGGVELPHIHGLGFSVDGRQLIVPAHIGLRVFVDGAWQSPDVPAIDYMGFVATDDGFYSSGHPAPASDLPNPLGLVKSTDGGKTLTQLGFAGESDFHLMGVGYNNHALYVLNPSANSKLATGLYYSLDDGKTWQQSAAQGVTSPPLHIAVHPTEANVVALSTEAGLLLSTNYGETFEPIDTSGPVTTAAFSPDGARLLFGADTLSVYELESKQTTALKAPALAPQDALSYIAINPVRPNELAVATIERNIFRSLDGGQTWQQIAKDGVGV